VRTPPDGLDDRIVQLNFSRKRPKVGRESLPKRFDAILIRANGIFGFLLAEFAVLPTSSEVLQLLTFALSSSSSSYGQRDAFAAAEGDPACGVAERLTRKGWPLAANPWRALRKCNVRWRS
jgi:hypothetical protein